MSEAALAIAALYYANAVTEGVARLQAAKPETVAKVRKIEDALRQQPQIDFVTEHVFHAGMYVRTVRIPANVIFTNVMVKIPTMLILNGSCDLLAGDLGVHLDGYNVLACEAGRKQVYITRGPVELTMMFPSQAQTVEEAEAEFTDEGENLLSHTNANDIVMTGIPCLESPQRPRS